MNDPNAPDPSQPSTPHDLSMSQGPPPATWPPRSPVDMGQGYSPAPAPPGAYTPPPPPPNVQWGGQANMGAGGLGVKNSALALILSFLLPGLGQIYNGSVGKGIGLIVGYIISCVLALFLIGIPFMFGLWIYGMVDAYQTAEKLNGRR